MFPVVNEAAKGFLKFVYNVSSSFGSNLFKFTIGQRMSDLDIFSKYFDEKFSLYDRSWFKHQLLTMSGS